jgi:hypothetical protein
MKILLVLLGIVGILQADIGQVTALSGSAALLRHDARLSVTEGIGILEKDRIETAARSKVQVILSDDTVITIGPESHYHFEQFRQGSDPRVKMRIDRGFFKAVTGTIGKIAPQKFSIETKATTIGIRGTQFMGHITDRGEAIGCSHGTITVTTQQGRYGIDAGQMLISDGERWTVKPLDLTRFAPVVGISRPRTDTSREMLPDASDMLEEQTLKEHQEQLRELQEQQQFIDDYYPTTGQIGPNQNTDTAGRP